MQEKPYRKPRPKPSTLAGSSPATPTLQKATGQPRELARYTADVGQRRIVAQRVHGTVQLRDEPAEHTGRRYLIEPALDSMAELEAIVADYVQLANRKGYVPMHGWY